MLLEVIQVLEEYILIYPSPFRCTSRGARRGTSKEEVLVVDPGKYDERRDGVSNGVHGAHQSAQLPPLCRRDRSHLPRSLPRHHSVRRLHCGYPRLIDIVNVCWGEWALVQNPLQVVKKFPHRVLVKRSGASQRSGLRCPAG